MALLDPADDLYTLANCFEELDLGTGGSVSQAAAIAGAERLGSAGVAEHATAQDSDAGAHQPTASPTRAAADLAESYLAQAKIGVYLTEALSLMTEIQEMPLEQLGGGDLVIGSGGSLKSRLASTNEPTSVKERSSLILRESHNLARDPLVFLQDYFARAAKGEHVIDTRFSFILGSSWNRLCFSKLLIDAFVHVEPKRRISQDDFLQLLRLHCEDFSSDLVRLCWSTFDHHARPPANKTVRNQSLDSQNDETTDTAGGPGEPVLDVLIEFGVALEAVILWLVYGDFFEQITERLCKSRATANQSDGACRSSWWDMVVDVEYAVAVLEFAAASNVNLRPPRFLVSNIQRCIPRGGNVRDLFLLMLSEDIGLFQHLRMALADIYK